MAESKIQIVLLSREEVFIGVPVNFMNNTVLVHSIAATLSASNIKLGLFPKGLFTYLSGNQDSYITFKLMYTDKKIYFEILKRSLKPSQDILLGQKMTILKVKEDSLSNVYAFKISSPY